LDEKTVSARYTESEGVLDKMNMEETSASNSDESSEESTTYSEMSVGKQNDRLLSITHRNAQSLRHKVTDLEAEAEDYDIVAISKTWLEPDIDSEQLKLFGFREIVRSIVQGMHTGAWPYIIIIIVILK
jgi:hypothetical protein